jgi:hypothetical protein
MPSYHPWSIVGDVCDRSTYTKIWLENQPSDTDMNDLTTRFQDQEELFGRMFERFAQGYSHVKASLEAYLCEH